MNVVWQFIEEAERSLHDAIMIVRRALKNSNVVAGGGAIDVSVMIMGDVLHSFPMHLGPVWCYCSIFTKSNFLTSSRRPTVC